MSPAARRFDYDDARARYQAGETVAALARAYGVTKAAIQRVVSPPEPLRPRDPRHGTTNGYINYGCRCDRCREAASDRHRRWSHESGYSEPMDAYVYRVQLQADLRDSHGTEHRYKRGCRCEECRAGVADARRARRLATKVACSHGCGTMVDGYNARYPGKPPECHSCAIRRIHAEAATRRLAEAG